MYFQTVNLDLAKNRFRNMEDPYKRNFFCFNPLPPPRPPPKTFFVRFIFLPFVLTEKLFSCNLLFSFSTLVTHHNFFRCLVFFFHFLSSQEKFSGTHTHIQSSTICRMARQRRLYQR